jgi:hypothetical protein
MNKRMIENGNDHAKLVSVACQMFAQIDKEAMQQGHYGDAAWVMVATLCGKYCYTVTGRDSRKAQKHLNALSEAVSESLKNPGALKVFEATDLQPFENNDYLHNLSESSSDVSVKAIDFIIQELGGKSADSSAVFFAAIGAAMHSITGGGHLPIDQIRGNIDLWNACLNDVYENIKPIAKN